MESLYAAKILWSCSVATDDFFCALRLEPGLDTIHEVALHDDNVAFDTSPTPKRLTERFCDGFEGASVQPRDDERGVPAAFFTLALEHDLFALAEVERVDLCDLVGRWGSVFSLGGLVRSVLVLEECRERVVERLGGRFPERDSVVSVFLFLAHEDASECVLGDDASLVAQMFNTLQEKSRVC